MRFFFRLYIFKLYLHIKGRKKLHFYSLLFFVLNMLFEINMLIQYTKIIDMTIFKFVLIKWFNVFRI